MKSKDIDGKILKLGDIVEIIENSGPNVHHAQGVITCIDNPKSLQVMLPTESYFNDENGYATDSTYTRFVIRLPIIKMKVK
jgi:hypothetical protein